MTDPFALENYEDWKHCITVKCNIPLTKTFVEERLVELKDTSNPKTIQFTKLYGSDHMNTIIRHLEQASFELNQ